MEPSARPSRSVTVFKIGGSLLDLPDLPARLVAVAALWPDSDHLFVIGGSETADLVRLWDARFQLGQETAHALAIEALGLNQELLLRLRPDLRLVRSRQQWELARAAGHPGLLCAKCFLKWTDTQPAQRLPHHWDVTSDSIAGAVARAWQADELVLLKSCELPAVQDIPFLADVGLVDRHFPHLLPHLPAVTWLCLRALADGSVSSRGTRIHPPLKAADA